MNMPDIQELEITAIFFSYIVIRISTSFDKKYINSYYALGYKQGKLENNNIVNLGGYGTYDLTQYDNYAEFAINKNIFITVNSVSLTARLGVGDAAGGLHFSASNAGQPYTASYSNGILKVSAKDITCSQTVSDPYEDVGSISGSASSSITVYLLP